jgi:hypothetical protein
MFCQETEKEAEAGRRKTDAAAISTNSMGSISGNAPMYSRERQKCRNCASGNMNAIIAHLTSCWMHLDGRPGLIVMVRKRRDYLNAMFVRSLRHDFNHPFMGGLKPPRCEEQGMRSLLRFKGESHEDEKE